MSELKGSQTEKNILAAFAGESQARNRYAYFASQAKKDDFVQMQAIFEETANQAFSAEMELPAGRKRRTVELGQKDFNLYRD